MGSTTNVRGLLLQNGSLSQCFFACTQHNLAHSLPQAPIILLKLCATLGTVFVVDCHLEACAWSFSPSIHFTVLPLVLLGHHCCSSLFHRAASFPCFCPSLPVHQSLNVAFAWSNDLMLCCVFVASLTSTNLIFDHADICR